MYQYNNEYLLILINLIMNDIVNKCLLLGHKFMSEMYLKQPRFIYSACRPFCKAKKYKNIKI